MHMQSEPTATSGDVKIFIKHRKKVLISEAPSLAMTGGKQNARLAYDSTLHARQQVELIETSAPIPTTIAVGST